MKILFFSKIFANPTLTFIYNEVEYMTQQGHEVLVLTLERKNTDMFPFDNVIELQQANSTLERKIRHNLQSRDFELGFSSKSLKSNIQNIINNFNPDVIHTHFGFESWHLLLNLPPGKVPIFITLHGFDVSHKLNSKRYCNTLRKILDRPDVTPFFVANFTKNNVENNIGTIPKAKILTCGIDISLFQRTVFSVKKKPFIFLQVSSFAEKKGHIYTVQAFNAFLKSSNKNAKLVFAGDGIERKNIEKQVQLLGLQDFVEFVGVVDRIGATKLMNNAHAFVHHSVTSKIGDTEGLPTALMEAMAMQLPVLSTLHSGIPELVENGVHGYLVAERDVAAYAEAMQQILAWDYLPESRDKVMQHFEKQQHGRLLEQYYQNKMMSDE